MAKKEATCGPVNPVPFEALRWCCDPEQLGFETTLEVAPLKGLVGQATAMEALRFGIECNAPGQNVFVRGLTGKRQTGLLKQLIEDLQPACRLKQDRCFVHNFSDPGRPRLISLTAGQGKLFKRRVRRFAESIQGNLDMAMGEEAGKQQRDAIQQRGREATEKLTLPFREALEQAGMALVPTQQGANQGAMILPVVEGKTVSAEEFDALHGSGKVSDERHAAFNSSSSKFGKQFAAISEELLDIRMASAKSLEAHVEGTAREALHSLAVPIRSEFPGPDVQRFMEEVIDDVVEHALAGGKGSGTSQSLGLYEVNVVVAHGGDQGCPVIVENTPTLTNLLGSIEREWGSQGPAPSSHRGIRGGSLLAADGGFLILDARDVMGENGAWKALIRTLRSSSLEIIPSDAGKSLFQQSLKPEAIPIHVRVLLLGDARTYYLLDSADPEFSHQFKVLADFDSIIERDKDGLHQYAAALAGIAEEEQLAPFHKGAVAALAEHGVRVASRRGDLTAHFPRIADIAREAAFLAKGRGSANVESDDVHEAVARTKRRAGLPSRKFQENLNDGTIHVPTEGNVVGQVNGLAVMGAGALTYGFPARITCSIGPGHAGIVDIEGRAALSGSIHTKGFHILIGLLRHLLRLEHPLAISASLAFEQSYGGIDGDSASGAECCCILSALTGVPLRQDLAMTGAVDQFGRIQAIGGVNEKVEGFFDICAHGGLNGSQGVIIPQSNARDLMLRGDVVEACRAGQFAIYAVSHVGEALQLFTGLTLGEAPEGEEFPPDSLLGIARQRAAEYWQKTLQRPDSRRELDSEAAAPAAQTET